MSPARKLAVIRDQRGTLFDRRGRDVQIDVCLHASPRPELLLERTETGSVADRDWQDLDRANDLLHLAAIFFWPR